MIRLENINFTYGESPGLVDICLEIEQGDSVVLIGPNGSGKSTLMKILNGLVVPESGRYFFDSEELTAQKRKDQYWMKRFHQRVGYLFQNSDSQLFCASVGEEIAFGPLQMGLSEAETETRLRDCLDLFGLQGLRERPPHHLSEGEKKKVALAGVLSMNPDVLVLDEPMNGLDPKTKRFLRELLMKLNGAGKTLIASTHDFAYVEGVFRTGVVLSADHRIIRVGPFAEIIADERFLRENNIL